jgi:hypothetical protein
MSESDLEFIEKMKDSNKYLASIIRCEDVIDTLNTYLAFKNNASVHFYPEQIEEIMNLLIDMKSMVFEYSEAFEKLQDILDESTEKNSQWDNLFKPQ